MGVGVTFSVSEAVQKEKDFIVTAQYRYRKIPSFSFDEVWWSCGFGTAYDPDNDNIKIGSITPQEIDGFKIINLQDYGYNSYDYEIQESNDERYFYASSNRKCVLHVKVKDYNVTEYRNGIYETETNYDTLDIKDKEQIKVTYTLL